MSRICDPRQARRLIGLALTPLLAGAIALIPGSTAAAIGPQAVKADPDKALTYWTAKRMRRAQPLDLLVKKARKLLKVPSTRPARFRPAAFPENGAPWIGGGKIVQTEGRVFFRFQGRDASCSGNAVTSDNKSVVMTAGHCVKLEGSYHTNWVFVPGYRDGNRPHGTWPASTLITTPQWDASEDINFDVAAAVVGQVGGERLTDVVGGQGIAFNQPRNQAMYAFGHPAAAPFDGERLIYCSGNTFTDFLLSRDHGMRCDMTGGSSGGPWFLNFDESSGAGTQNSVNSFKYNFLPTYMFGPYFGDDAENVYNEAQAG